MTMMLRRVPQYLCQVHRIQVPLRLRSTAHADAEYAAEPADKPADWDLAKPYSAIPGPKSNRFVGSLMSFLPTGAFFKVKIEDVLDTVAAHGPVAKMTGIWGRPDVILLSDPKEIEIALRSEGAWPIRAGADSLLYYFKNRRKGLPMSLVSSQGKEWQEFRTAVNQVMLQPRNIKQYVEPIDRVTQEIIDRMRRIREQNSLMPANFSDELAKWALESITLVALDTKLGCISDNPNPDGAKMVEYAHTVFDSVYKLDVLPSPWKYVSTPTYRRFTKAMDGITEISSKYVKATMERLKNVPKTELKDRSYSVLETLLVKTEDPDRAVAMALDMILGGIDATSTAVATVLYQLAINPEKQKILQEELDRVIPDKSIPITKEQLEELKFMRACIKETMRVMPITIGNSRTSVKDLVLGGYQIPAGTMLNTPNYNLGKNEKYFPRANEFLPERWLSGATDLKCKNPFAYLPFGFGPRMCVGRRFADLEIETIVAKIFRNFNLEWNNPPAALKMQVVLVFADPLRFKVTDRA
ncbi:probable cytochrome P450 12a4, mitochondrial isoform X2 [Frankliniella occidentalis]|uniref:Probable cytochrome P450 12a4, mitochondrial isoform X2 n=1 Tax=Frankliniella occidentalis TaxID=133901 RepID=A0A9C6UEY9_FRAOC|nr:probable cytochrome P450 12a4, mitochondrial isoform X2 [Frankliniella occidentalis]